MANNLKKLNSNRVMVVKKSNKLALAHYNWSLLAQKIFLLYVACLQSKTNTDGISVSFNTKYIKDHLAINTNTLYQDLKSVAQELSNCKIEYEDDLKKQFTYISPFPYVDYTEGIFTLRAEQSVIQQIMNIEPKFMKYSLSNVKKIKSCYTLRIYEALKANLFKNYAEFPIDEFREIIGVREKIITKTRGKDIIEIIDKYTKFSEFKRNVLDKAQKEIETLTDIRFTYDLDRKGSKVIRIKFFIYNNIFLNEYNEVSNQEKTENPQSEYEYQTNNLKVVNNILFDECRHILPSIVSDQGIFKILEAANDDIQLIKRVYEISKTQKNIISNLTGWILEGVKKNYQTPKAILTRNKNAKTDNKFNSYPQRAYTEEDYSNLEKALLMKQMSIFDPNEDMLLETKN